MAQKILMQSQPGKPYAPVVEIESEDNHQGKRTVYKDEYGVCVLVQHPDILSVLHKGNRVAYPDASQRPEITPHITLIQGVFRGQSFEHLKQVTQSIAAQHLPHTMTLDNQFVPGGGGNTFWDITQGKDFFNVLNQQLSEQTKPDAPMKQVLDDIATEDADLSQMHPGGAWRDFKP